MFSIFKSKVPKPSLSSSSIASSPQTTSKKVDDEVSNKSASSCDPRDHLLLDAVKTLEKMMITQQQQFAQLYDLCESRFNKIERQGKLIQKLEAENNSLHDRLNRFQENDTSYRELLNKNLDLIIERVKNVETEMYGVQEENIKGKTPITRMSLQANQGIEKNHLSPKILKDQPLPNDGEEILQHGPTPRGNLKIPEMKTTNIPSLPGPNSSALTGSNELTLSPAGSSAKAKHFENPTGTMGMRTEVNLPFTLYAASVHLGKLNQPMVKSIFKQCYLRSWTPTQDLLCDLEFYDGRMGPDLRKKEHIYVPAKCKTCQLKFSFTIKHKPQEGNDFTLIMRTRNGICHAPK
ncbi:uncharacterized protein LOC110854432 isoform X2 [Folsomia candida]|uniref:Uncharacterized protein n=1 Tax=Folsomia candida TaxID=158441 RepID=A0A226DXS2_FOLCA|nr:uncharacterized protein LOC110854432 isoform X2 [Folsomia candida]OXA49497.1 hypothetical protein Fcan01_15698 [Folsomia candida]